MEMEKGLNPKMTEGVFDNTKNKKMSDLSPFVLKISALIADWTKKFGPFFASRKLKKRSVSLGNNLWRYTWRLKMERIYSLSLVLKELNNMSHNDESEMVTQK